MDAANIDLKGFTDAFYEKVTFGKLPAVLETLEYLRHETDVWFEITTLLIPGHNDSDEEIEQECAWLVEHLGTDVPLHFTAFHPDFKMMDVAHTPPQTCAGPAASPWTTGCATSTPATCTTRTARRPPAPPVVRRSWSRLVRHRGVRPRRPRRVP